MPELRVGESVTLTVEKFDPSRDSAPRLETYKVPYTKEMRVLEALDYVVEELGESLSYQWFCGVKKCGMCGVMVNGRQTLGCWEPVEPEMLVRPLAGFPIVPGSGDRPIAVLRGRSVNRALDTTQAALWRLSRSHYRGRALGSGRHHALHRMHAVRIGLSRERRAVHGPGANGATGTIRSRPAR